MSQWSHTLAIALALGVAIDASAASDPTSTHAKPSSFAPRPDSGPHVYGSPLGPAIVGQRQPGARRPPSAKTHATHAGSTLAKHAKPARAPAHQTAQAPAALKRPTPSS